jgi:tRNA nucleotidyltransferase (CCA-adding enzyme)
MRSWQAALEALRADPCGARLLRAFAAGEGVHLVGGAVRDLLLAREPRELDLVVEGDVDAAAARLGGEVTAHDRFGTVLVRADGCAFDLVRARAESYARPGALPEVRPGTLDEDLQRRDVTINAIALGFDGTLTTVDCALDDLAAGVLRVLHDASFVDDPTRVWRVARYAARLGFGVEERTRSLAAAADPSTVSGDRLGAELRLALREPDPPATFAAVRDLNPRYLPEGFEPRPAALRAALDLLPDDGRPDLLTLAACTTGMEAVALLRWLDDMGFPAPERDLVAAASRFVTGAPLRAARTNAEIARAARGAPAEAVALVGGDNARRWLGELRHVRLEIDGRDLLAAGIPEGPEIGARLARALDRKLDGEASGREEELAAALEDGGGRGRVRS